METRELSQLTANPQNPRGAIVHDVALRELSVSIKTQGVLQPILITPKNVIVAGHRRVAAAKLANLTSIPVIVKELTETEQLQIILIENLQRADLNVIQEGKAYLALMAHGLSANQIHKALGVGNTRIASRIAVANLPEETHDAFASKALSLECVSSLEELPKEKQIEWVERAIKNQWTGRELSCRIYNETWVENKTQHTDEEMRAIRLSRLEGSLTNADRRLDPYPDLRQAQMLIRQAVTVIVEAGSRKAKAA